MTQRTFPRVLPVGDAALAVEWGDVVDPRINARVRALDEVLKDDPPPGFVESVPTYRSLLVAFEPLKVLPAEIREAVLARLGRIAETEPPVGRLHHVPTCYGGDAGPDLPGVAGAAGLSERDVVRLHSSGEFTAFMLGFTPGFAYLGPLPAELETKRRKTPRERIPPGSVAVAALQTGIYPQASPGGWNIIGRTAVKMFDPGARVPALILPGDRVRFHPTDRLEETREAPLAPTAGGGGTAIEVLDAGFQTTVQDLGRPGLRRYGVTRGGAMDAPALRAGNELLGNPEGAAALECTLLGPRLLFEAPACFAVTGADLGATLKRADLGDWEVPLGMKVYARPGNVLWFSGRRTGCRVYVAVGGGLDVPLVLGSRATDLAGGFGGFLGRPLRPGDRLATLGPTGTPRLERWRGPSPLGSVDLRVVLGPQADHFPKEALALFLSHEFEVGEASNRVGCRLSGPPLPHKGGDEIVTDGMMPGSVQVPGDGQPIVMTADAPTTGGYPKIATVVSEDLPLLAQLVPGNGRVRFHTFGGES